MNTCNPRSMVSRNLSLTNIDGYVFGIAVKNRKSESVFGHLGTLKIENRKSDKFMHNGSIPRPHSFRLPPCHINQILDTTWILANLGHRIFDHFHP